MPQNKYDDPEFFARYSAMSRSVGGLDEAGEWETFRALLPDLREARVLDLGCGFGWHCRDARQRGARSVVGVDLSENMLARARAATDDAAIEYRRASIEEVTFDPSSFDIILSSLALHYVERFDEICVKLHRWLAPGGACVLSMEHPVFTARAAQDWCYDADGARLHWPIDDYQQEGRRSTSWMADDVVKFHRTVATIVNGLVEAGFRIGRLEEPRPPASMMARPGMVDELRRPMFLIVSAVKPAER